MAIACAIATVIFASGRCCSRIRMRKPARVCDLGPLATKLLGFKDEAVVITVFVSVLQVCEIHQVGPVEGSDVLPSDESGTPPSFFGDPDERRLGEFVEFDLEGVFRHPLGRRVAVDGFDEENLFAFLDRAVIARRVPHQRWLLFAFVQTGGDTGIHVQMDVLVRSVDLCLGEGVVATGEHRRSKLRDSNLS